MTQSSKSFCKSVLEYSSHSNKVFDALHCFSQSRLRYDTSNTPQILATSPQQFTHMVSRRFTKACLVPRASHLGWFLHHLPLPCLSQALHINNEFHILFSYLHFFVLLCNHDLIDIFHALQASKDKTNMQLEFLSLLLLYSMKPCNNTFNNLFLKYASNMSSHEQESYIVIA